MLSPNWDEIDHGRWWATAHLERKKMDYQLPLLDVGWKWIINNQLPKGVWGRIDTFGWVLLLFTWNSQHCLLISYTSIQNKKLKKQQKTNKQTNKKHAILIAISKWAPAHRRISIPTYNCLYLLLGWEDLLEKETATHSSTLAWRIPRTEEPGRLQCVGMPTFTLSPLGFHQKQILRQ